MAELLTAGKVCNEKRLNCTVGSHQKKATSLGPKVTFILFHIVYSRVSILSTELEKPGQKNKRPGEKYRRRSVEWRMLVKACNQCKIRWYHCCFFASFAQTDLLLQVLHRSLPSRLLISLQLALWQNLTRKYVGMGIFFPPSIT